VPAVDTATLERIFREESGRVIATLVRLFGDIDLAEEMVQDAFVVASARWPETGLPPNPGGWITTNARNRAIDRLRRESCCPQRPSSRYWVKPTAKSVRRSSVRYAAPALFVV
jgi:predicted RNA polymerase sigma factor